MILTLGAFHTSFTLGIETLARLILTHLYLQKLSGHYQLRAFSLLSNHTIKSLFKNRHANHIIYYYLSLDNIIFKQRLNIKSSIVNMNNHLNGIFLSFNSLNSKFSSRYRLIDIFSSCFSFHWADHRSKETKSTHIWELDKIVFIEPSNPKTIIVVLDTSIKINVIISIVHIHSHSNLIKKTLHHAINITSIEAELFTIKCSINQAIQFSNISCIIIITDLIYIAQWIFDSSIHPYKIQSIYCGNH